MATCTSIASVFQRLRKLGDNELVFLVCWKVVKLWMNLSKILARVGLGAMNSW